MKNMIKRIAVLFLVLSTLVTIAKPVVTEAKAKTSAFFITRGARGTFFGKNRVIALKGVPNVMVGGSPNQARFKVFLEDKLLASKDYKYTSSTDTITYKYQFKKLGEYKVVFSHLSWDSFAETFMEDYTKEATISVVEPKAAPKTTPVFSASNEYNGSTYSSSIQLAGFDSSATTYIYRAGSKSGAYKLIKKVKAATYVDQMLKTGKTYYYKIKVSVKSGKKTYTTKKSKAVSVKL